MMNRTLAVGVRCCAFIVPFALGLAGACGGEGSGAPSAGGGGSSSTTSFGDGECGACVKAACASQVSSCGTDPGCASYLACLFACAESPAGGPEPSCEAACAAPTDEPGVSSYTAFDVCRAGSSSQCSACPAPDAGTDGSVDGAGGDSGSSGGILGQQCSASADPDTCIRCEEESCCETRKECKDDPVCGEYLACLQGCTGSYSGCVQSCAEGLAPESVSKFARRLGCLTLFCSGDTQCGGLNSCTQCINEKCPAFYAATMVDEETMLFGACVEPCGSDITCHEDCLAKYPGGADPYTALTNCVIAQGCDIPCGR